MTLAANVGLRASAQPTQNVFTVSMPALKPWLDLCRVSNLPTVWSNVLAASLLAMGGFIIAPCLLLVVALSAFYLAGMSFNDLCDLEHDREHRPDRPLPSGRITLSGARTLTLALFGTSLTLLAAAPHLAGLGGGALLMLAIVAYDLYHKGQPLSILVMASCRLLVYFTVALALTGEIGAWVWVAAVMQFVYVLAISLVARRESRRPASTKRSAVPLMLSGIALLDGAVLAVAIAPLWLLAGLSFALLTHLGQGYVRGD